MLNMAPRHRLREAEVDEYVVSSRLIILDVITDDAQPSNILQGGGSPRIPQHRAPSSGWAHGSMAPDGANIFPKCVR